MSENSAPGSGESHGQGPEGAPEQSHVPPPPQTPVTPPPAAGSSNKSLMLILSYVWILALIPLLVDKDEEVQWHAKNGIVLLLAEIILWVALTILGFVPVIGVILSCGVIPLAFIVFLILRIVGIMKALKGDKLRLPVIVDFVDQWK